MVDAPVGFDALRLEPRIVLEQIVQRCVGVRHMVYDQVTAIRLGTSRPQDV